MKEAENDANLQVLRQSLFLAFGKTSLLVWTRTRWSRSAPHKLYNSKCELAYETLSTYGLVFLPHNFISYSFYDSREVILS